MKQFLTQLYAGYVSYSRIAGRMFWKRSKSADTKCVLRLFMGVQYVCSQVHRPPTTGYSDLCLFERKKHVHKQDHLDTFLPRKEKKEVSILSTYRPKQKQRTALSPTQYVFKQSARATVPLHGAALGRDFLSVRYSSFFTPCGPS